MKRLALFLLLAASLFAERPPVVKPRSKAQDYPAVHEQQSLTLGAAQLSAKLVRKAFVSNIGKNYIVVEVAVYPKSETKISPQDFVLRSVDEKGAIYPADPVRMANEINEKDQKGTDVAVHPVAGLEVSTGSAPDDPYYGNRRSGTHVTTTSGVMVDMNSKKKDPKTSDGNRKAMVAELTEKSLPESTVSKPVAGYLFFPVTPGKTIHFQLEYQSPGGAVVIPLPSPSD